MVERRFSRDPCEIILVFDKKENLRRCSVGNMKYEELRDKYGLKNATYASRIVKDQNKCFEEFQKDVFESDKTSFKLVMVTL